jgi:hypothetical protein
MTLLNCMVIREYEKCHSLQIDIEILLSLVIGLCSYSQGVHPSTRFME